MKRERLAEIDADLASDTDDTGNGKQASGLRRLRRERVCCGYDLKRQGSTPFANV
jgi:hypothetical protein